MNSDLVKATRDFKKGAFSLMEVMLVLLIVAIIAAATAPMITTRLGKGMIDDSGLWVRNMQGDIYYNRGAAIVGADQYHDVPNVSPEQPGYVITGDSIAFTEPNGRYRAALYMGDDDGTVAISDHIKDKVGANSVVIGLGAEQLADEAKDNNVVIGFKPTCKGENSVAIGTNVQATANGVVAIGSSEDADNNVTLARTDNAVVIGSHARDTALNPGADAAGGSVVIGAGAAVAHSHIDPNSVAIKGRVSNTSDSVAILGNVHHGGVAADNFKNNIAIGGEVVVANNSIAIGFGSEIQHPNRVGLENSVVIGSGQLNESDSIMIGSEDANVVRIGDLSLSYDDNNEMLNIKSANDYPINLNGFIFDRTGNRIFFKPDGSNGNSIYFESSQIKVDNIEVSKDITAEKNLTVKGDVYLKGLSNDLATEITDLKDSVGGIQSDKRLKNVGKVYNAGLEELKKLDLYHFTYKKDEKNIPHVGVMAQDLEKVFPNAVTKGTDGYLRIRLEDMFYAMINAVKELDNKISGVINQIKDLTMDVVNIKNVHSEQQRVIEEQAKVIAEQDKIINELTKKVDKLSKKIVVE